MSDSVSTLDEAKLGAYLDQHIESFEGLISAEKFAGGQSNPTFLLTAKSGQYVLRRKPPGELLKSAHAVDREYKVLTALAGTKVPVAHAYHLCEDDDVIGSMFYVMSFEEGRILWDPALLDLDKEQRRPIHLEMVRVLAEMHNIDITAVGLADYGKPGNYYERQIGRWSKQYRAAETHKIDAMDSLIEWLPNNIPADDGEIRLIHGDYRLDNIMFHPTEPRAIAVLDWELSTLGHPLADLAYLCMCLRLTRDGSLKGLGGLDRGEVGVPTEEEMVKQYCELRNIDDIENWNFYLTFSFFRLASICQGVYKRAIMGNASNKQALETGNTTEPLAQMGMSLIK
ncbi:MAG: phosphotransferase family protein [Pseudomonadales bacterium]